jgi:hypothetical protein
LLLLLLFLLLLPNTHSIQFLHFHYHHLFTSFHSLVLLLVHYLQQWPATCLKT